ncbi:MAG: hypothetical protein LBS77_04475 [Desulfovibrio sp.]|jgi:hypothetical protein|nr:hypothetical protein [Desulfovibrio sp.]
MKTASPEVRSIAACHSGIPRQQLADIAGYHLNSISRWIREFKRAREVIGAQLKLFELIDNNVNMTGAR